LVVGAPMTNSFFAGGAPMTNSFFAGGAPMTNSFFLGAPPITSSFFGAAEPDGAARSKNCGAPPAGGAPGGGGGRTAPRAAGQVAGLERERVRVESRRGGGQLLLPGGGRAGRRGRAVAHRVRTVRIDGTGGLRARCAAIWGVRRRSESWRADAAFSDSTVVWRGDFGSTSMGRWAISQKQCPPLNASVQTVSLSRKELSRRKRALRGASPHDGLLASRVTPSRASASFPPRNVPTREASRSAAHASAPTQTRALARRRLPSTPRARETRRANWAPFRVFAART
jgi:hypothetical protein